MGGKAYTQEEKDTIIELHATKSYKEIADLIGRSPNAIKRMISLWGYSKPKPRP